MFILRELEFRCCKDVLRVAQLCCSDTKDIVKLDGLTYLQYDHKIVDRYLILQYQKA